MESLKREQVPKRFTKQDILKIFQLSNIEYIEDKEDQNPDDELTRKEYFEAFIRIAQCKYGFPIKGQQIYLKEKPDFDAV